MSWVLVVSSVCLAVCVSEVILMTLCTCSFRSFVFFFSSRRRHTRCSRDWSSDVCSSDLMIRHTRCSRDWSSDVCSSDLLGGELPPRLGRHVPGLGREADQEPPALARAESGQDEIGRASCRERV